MTIFRKLFYVVLAALVTGFALPAGAQKLFSISTTSLTFPAVNAPYTVTWLNSPENSGGNSNINSVRLDIPAGLRIVVDGWTTNNPTGTVLGGGTAYIAANGPNPITLGQSYGPYTSATQLSIKDFTGAKPSGSFVLDLHVSGNSPGCSSFAKGYAWTGNTWGGTQFTASPAGSDIQTNFTCTLGCDFTNNSDTTAGNLDPLADLTHGSPGGDTPDWGLIRGPNTDGGTCSPIPFVFTLDPSTNSAAFIANKLGQKVIVEYVVVWAPVLLDSAGATAGWTQRRPNFAYGFAIPPTPSQYVPALSCVVDNYLLGSAALPITPSVAPFLGSPYPQYQPGTKAQMCAAQHGWTAIGGGYVQYWTKVIDTDGWTKMP